jgi:hypothetical protein
MAYFILCIWLVASIAATIGSLFGGVQLVRKIHPFCNEPNSGLAKISVGIGIAVCIAGTLFFSVSAALAIYALQLGVSQ